MYYFLLLAIYQIFTCTLYSEVTLSLRINKLSIPKSVELECDYDLEGESLSFYEVKWYKDNHVFYRFTPNGKPEVEIFPVSGIKVNVSETNCTRQFNYNYTC